MNNWLGCWTGNLVVRRSNPPPPYHYMNLCSVASKSNPTRFVYSQPVCLLPVVIFNHVIFISNCLFPCFQQHARKLAISKLRA